jgi:hypothetical protein
VTTPTALGFHRTSRKRGGHSSRNRRPDRRFRGDQLAAVLAQNPALSDYGFGDCDGRRLSDAERQEQFRRAGWLQEQPRTKAINRRVSTYWVKHQAEAELGCWIAAGIFTAAAIGAGFIVKPCGPSSPNAYLNIATRITTRPTLGYVAVARH